MAYLVLVRHGESKWNRKGLWTGLTNIDLDRVGKKKSRRAGQAISDIHFQVAYTSKLKRAKETLNEIKTQLNDFDFPVVENAALNERDYGELTGKNKWKIRKEYGNKQFLKWRRSWDSPVPGGETLKDVYERVTPYYKEHILPDLLAGKNVLVVAHGNSLRALAKNLDDISEREIPHLEIATAEVDVYNIDETGKVVSKDIKNVSWIWKLSLLVERMREKLYI